MNLDQYRELKGQEQLVDICRAAGVPVDDIPIDGMRYNTEAPGQITLEWPVTFIRHKDGLPALNGDGTMAEGPGGFVTLAVVDHSWR